MTSEPFASLSMALFARARSENRDPTPKEVKGELDKLGNRLDVVEVAVEDLQSKNSAPKEENENGQA